jgi:PAS domain S-box-containing protein
MYVRVLLGARERLYKKQAVMMIFAGIIPVATNFLWLMGMFTFLASYVNPANFFLSMGGTIMLYALMKMGFLDIIPIAMKEFFTSISDAVVIMNMNRAVADFNPAALKLFSSIKIGMDAGKMDETIAESLYKFGSTGEGDFSYKYRNETYWGRFSYVKNGDVCIGLLLTLTNISGHEWMEEEMRIKDTAMNTSINGICMFNMNGKISYVNQSFIAMCGYTDEKEAIGKQIKDFIDSREAEKKITEELKRKSVWMGELQIMRKDGSRLDVSVVANIVKSDDGRPLRLMASFIDITEHKKMRKELERNLNELEKFREMAVGRELKMMELKKRLEKLEAKDSRSKPG